MQLVFSNTDEVELLVNGVSQGIKKPDQHATLIWENTKLVPGDNLIEAKGSDGEIVVSDRCNLILQ